MKALTLSVFTFLSLQVSALTIGSYNIRNFDYDQRYKITTNKSELTNILRNLKADVLSIQEINNTQAWEKYVQSSMPGFDTEVTRCGGEHGQRLGFLYNKATIELVKFEEDLSISEPGSAGSCDTGSRPAAIGLFRVKATGQRFFGITLHLKSGSQADSVQKRSKQFEVLKKIIQNLKAKNGVNDFYFAGDLNTTEFNKKGVDFEMLRRLSQDLGMRNLAENLKCSAYYWGGTDDGIESPSMLDHIFVTPGLQKNPTARAQVGGHCQKVSCREVPIKELGISYEAVSDHCPLSATIQ
jgi:endonuclease/exonuclease/phosphatase family metal-dependent hydrolase